MSGRAALVVVVVAACLPTLGCGDTQSSPVSPTAATPATVRFVYRASTSPRTDLPADRQDCVRGVGATHIHPGWRGFARIDMTPVGADRWEIAFSDVPVNGRQSIRVSDGNACDENPTGAATRNVFANDALLVEVVPTPGSGTEPGLAFRSHRPAGSHPDPTAGMLSGTGVGRAHWSTLSDSICRVCRIAHI